MVSLFVRSAGLAVVVGQGYVGLPLAMAAVQAGYRVIGFEIDKVRADRLAAGDSYIEDVSADELTAALATGRYTPTVDSRECTNFDVAVISVPTPLREGLPDLGAVEAAARMLGAHLRPDATVILESTTYPGTTDEVLCPLLEAGSGLTAGQDFHVGYSPERVDPGNRTWTLTTTPKVVSGIDAASLSAVRAFFDGIVEKTVPVRTTRAAELTKLLENTFRHVNIALVNELTMYAAEMGIDIWEVIDAAGTKPFGFMRFTPGPGVGGHCLPIDPSYLSWRVERSIGRAFRFIELANDINDHMPEYVVRRVTEGLNRQRKAVNGSRVLLLGLAYKANTGDARETPSRRVADRLVSLGADVRAADPHVPLEQFASQIRRVELTRVEIEASDAVVVLTDHDAFDYLLVGRCATYVLDCRRRVLGSQVEYL
jgi:UDP-N-acetyl-D-glucosamine dehydrogenase